MDWSLMALPGLLIWIIILLFPWRPWSTRESLEARPGLSASTDLSRLTVLIPARNEEQVIGETLDGLARHDRTLRILLIDDQSTDQTSAIAESKGLPNLRIITGEPLPQGWNGKLWALEQGIQHAETDLVLLLDADICLEPGTINSLLHKLETEGLDMISLMARLRMQGFWEKLLIPAFIFFFKLLYPFSLSNSVFPHVAAAAGGVILVKRKLLEKIGAFACLSDSLIDDCALAKRIKHNGGRIWTGLTHSAVSLRDYDRFSVIREMVARTAFTQLRYSWFLLFLCTVLMLSAFVLPVLVLFSGSPAGLSVGLGTMAIMIACYLPTLIYYEIHPIWALTMPVTGVLYLFMTWLSALQHLFSSGSQWKGRHYSVPQSK